MGWEGRLGEGIGNNILRDINMARLYNYYQ